MYKKILNIIFVFFCLKSALRAQNYEGDYRFDTRINGLVPHPFSNKALRNTFIGVYTVSGSQNIHLFQNFYIGICGANLLYKIPTNKLVSSNGYKLSNQLQINSVGLNIGYDYYIAPKAFLSSTIALGQSFGKFTSIQTVTPVPIIDKFSAGFLQVSSNLNFILEDHMGLGLLVSYTFINNSFNPYNIALNQFKSYDDNDLKGAISYLEIGFNLYFCYVKKKK